MIVEINKEPFIVYDRFEDLTLKRYNDIVAYLESVDAEKMDVIRGKDSEKDPEVISLFQIIAEIVCRLSDIPYSTLEKVVFIDLYATYAHLIPIVETALGNIQYQFQGIESFKIGDEKVLTPAFDDDINGEPIFCAFMTAEEFCECSDLNQAGFRYANNIITIMCRPEGEAYDEKTCKDRAKGYNPTMNIVFECLMHLSGVHERAKSMFPNLYKGSGSSEFGWSGNILWLGEPDTTGKLNVYEFLRRLSFKLKSNE